ncbi:MAG: rhamnulokinase family protein [Planctomycetota bacterium]
MDQQAFLAIDLGAESGRAMVATLDLASLGAGELGTRTPRSGRGGARGRGGDAAPILALEEVHRFPNHPCRLPTGWHWNVTGLWENVLEGTRKAVTLAKERGLPLVSLGVDTWGVDYGLLGRSGQLLGLPYCYRDERNGPAFEKTIARLGREVLYEATGIQFMALNTLFQLVAQHDAEPALLDHAARLLFMPDLLHYFFTGESVVESSIASTSQMIDPRTGQWVLELLAGLGLPTQMLGPTVPSGTPIGPMTRELGIALEADASLRVIAPAAHDTASAVAAVPADPATRWCYLSSGTWSLLGAELPRPCITSKSREAPFTNEGGVGGTIRFLKNITGLWLVQECRRHLESHGEHRDYAELTEAAERASPFRTLIDTAHAPFLAPGEMPAKIAAFARRTRQPEPAGTGELIRCCLESLALTYRRTLSQLEEVLGTRFDVLHIVGGGARNRLLNQMAADATNRRVLAGPAEATAIGNVLVQAMGAGLVEDLAHIRRVVRGSVSPEIYEPRETACWDRAHERFCALLDRRGAGG